MSQRHFDFARKISVLKLVAVEMGYEITLGHAYRCRDCKVGSEFSLHKERLAHDIHLYEAGVWLEDGTGHKELHDVWDLMGGARRIKNDLNHYQSK
jgi:hypothetical protein